jgi:hypothetical protein
VRVGVETLGDAVAAGFLVVGRFKEKLPLAPAEGGGGE